VVGQVNFALVRCDAGGAPVDRNWRRVRLPRDVDPGETIEVSCEIVFEAPDTFVLRAELVSELVAWFETPSDSIAVTVSLP
jgi:hypothetical protein